LPKELSEEIFRLTTADAVTDWLAEAGTAIGGVSWQPLGGIPNNVHTVQVASDPALALVERPINGIDALLDLRARERGETASTPHEAAVRWFGVPPGGLAAMDEGDRRKLADHLRITMLESGDAERPTVTIQDQGTGQRPDAFPSTHLSLLASNKKDKRHQMGVYNAGAAASLRFARYTVVISRLAPSLLNGHADEVGMTVIRYNPLDPDRYKSGTYEFVAAKDGSIIRLDIEELPDLPFGTYVKLVEYQVARYARAAHEPKQSLWHLFHAALPDPALPLRIVETRADRFAGVRGVERRTVSGLLHLLSRPGTADYADVREVDMGPDFGKVTLRYFVLNEDRDPDAYVTSEQGLTLTLNGQRQLTKDRAWIKRNLELPFLYRRLVVVIDGTTLTNATQREVFASTRESGVDTPETKKVLERVVQELLEDENLDGLDEAAKQRVLEDATKSTTDRVKRQLASEIAAFMKGELSGAKGGRRKRRKRRRRRPPGPPPIVDDSLMPEIPDRLEILTDPIRIEPGATAALRLAINAKNDFLPKYAGALSIVLGPELAKHVSVRSKGRLLGGKVRVTLEAQADAPTTSSSLQVALVVPEHAVLLTATSTIEVVEPKEDDTEDKRSGGEPNVDVHWVGRDKWTDFQPTWDGQTVGVCYISRADLGEPTAVTKVEWFLNEAFSSYEQVVSEKRLGEAAIKTFREGFEVPVLFGLFKQKLAEEAKEAEADEEGRQIEIPDDYVRGEQARMARAVLMALEPGVRIAEIADVA